MQLEDFFELDCMGCAQGFMMTGVWCLGCTVAGFLFAKFPAAMCLWEGRMRGGNSHCKQRQLQIYVI